MFLSGTPETTALGEGKAAQSQVKMEEDFNRFLNLLITQLKNQDPLDPMSSNEFTSQLVQFAGVEQQIQSNSNLEKILESQQSSQLGSMIGYIDRTIEAEGYSMPVENGTGQFTYELDASASNNTITIRDAAGKVVYFTDGETMAGKHTFTWDGKDNHGMPLDDGTYTVTVSAHDTRGEMMNVVQTTIGRVTGVRIDGDQTYLEVGDGLEVEFDKIISVRDTPAVVD